MRASFEQRRNSSSGGERERLLHCPPRAVLRCAAACCCCAAVPADALSRCGALHSATRPVPPFSAPPAQATSTDTAISSDCQRARKAQPAAITPHPSERPKRNLGARRATSAQKQTKVGRLGARRPMTAFFFPPPQSRPRRAHCSSKPNLIH